MCEVPEYDRASRFAIKLREIATILELSAADSAEVLVKNHYLAHAAYYSDAAQCIDDQSEYFGRATAEYKNRIAQLETENQQMKEALESG